MLNTSVSVPFPHQTKPGEGSGPGGQWEAHELCLLTDLGINPGLALSKVTLDLAEPPLPSLKWATNPCLTALLHGLNEMC